jgi:DNA-binding transcriptional LysR family regulator
MMNLPNLDMDVLRTLVSAHELGTFQRAAVEVGRSQSAVSQQLRRLEEQVGEKLFQKRGRGLVPTEAGEVVLGYARRILGLNDAAVLAVRGQLLEGVVRFGLPGDFAESWLPAALGRFNRAHPSVRIEAVVDRNRRLLERLDQGELDLVLALGSPSRPDGHLLTTLPLVWIGPRSVEPIRSAGAPLPLAVFDSPCFFRQTALAVLDRAGISSRIAFVSPSLHGLWAAVEAGLGVTLRTPVGLPPGLKVLTDGPLPSVSEPPVSVCLHDRQRALGPAAAALRAILVDEVISKLGAPPAPGSPRVSRHRRRLRRTGRRRAGAP